MQDDPLVQWQQLSGVYGKMYDQELLNLAADSQDLTETAKQVLDIEMQKRGLKSAGAPRKPGVRSDLDSALQAQPLAGANCAYDGEPEVPPEEYTWKTVLCECQTQEQANQVREMLRRAGIESWDDGHCQSYSPYAGLLDAQRLQILVAADQLEEAREVTARPVPQAIVDESTEEPAVFEPPTCPKCGARDPVLEGVNPVNAWKCEACGIDWTEPIDGGEPGSEKDAR